MPQIYNQISVPEIVSQNTINLPEVNPIIQNAVNVPEAKVENFITIP